MTTSTPDNNGGNKGGMSPTDFKLNTEPKVIPIGYDPLVIENPDGSKGTCWCMPFFFHPGCQTFHDSVIEQFAQESEPTLNALAMTYLGWSESPNFMQTFDEDIIHKEVSVWINILPDSLIVLVHEMAKGIFLQWLVANGFNSEQQVRALAVADYIFGCKVSRQSWEEMMLVSNFVSPVQRLHHGFNSSEFIFWKAAVCKAYDTNDYTWLKSKDGQKATLKAISQFVNAPTEQDLQQFRRQVSSETFEKVRAVMIELGVVIPGQDGEPDKVGQIPEQLEDEEDRQTVEKFRETLDWSQIIGSDAHDKLNDEDGFDLPD